MSTIKGDPQADVRNIIGGLNNQLTRLLLDTHRMKKAKLDYNLRKPIQNKLPSKKKIDNGGKMILFGIETSLADPLSSFVKSVDIRDIAELKKIYDETSHLYTIDFAKLHDAATDYLKSKVEKILVVEAKQEGEYLVFEKGIVDETGKQSTSIPSGTPPGSLSGTPPGSLSGRLTNPPGTASGSSQGTPPESPLAISDTSGSDPMLRESRSYTVSEPETFSASPLTNLSPQPDKPRQVEHELPATSELIHPTDDELPATSELIRPTDDELPATSELIRPTDDELPATSELIHPTDDELPATSELIRPTDDELPATSELIRPTDDELPATSELIHPTDDELPATSELIRPTDDELPSNSKLIRLEKDHILENSQKDPPVKPPVRPPVKPPVRAPVPPPVKNPISTVIPTADPPKELITIETQTDTESPVNLPIPSVIPTADPPKQGITVDTQTDTEPTADPPKRGITLDTQTEPPVNNPVISPATPRVEDVITPPVPQETLIPAIKKNPRQDQATLRAALAIIKSIVNKSKAYIENNSISQIRSDLVSYENDKIKRKKTPKEFQVRNEFAQTGLNLATLLKESDYERIQKAIESFKETVAKKSNKQLFKKEIDSIVKAYEESMIQGGPAITTETANIRGQIRRVLPKNIKTRN